MCYIIYLITTQYILYPYFLDKNIYLHIINIVVVSLCVSQGGGHFETHLPGYVHIEGIGSTMEILDIIQVK